MLLRITDKLIHILQKVRFKLTEKAYKKDSVLNQNSALANKYKGRKCYLLGNSQSLNKHDLLRLKDEMVFCVNTFFVHENFDEIKPGFYAFADQDFYNFEDEATREWWGKMIEKTKNKGITFFFPIQMKGSFVHEAMKDEKICFLDLSVNFTAGSVRNFNIAQPVNWVQNVLILCIQLAIYMGFEEIYLLGADHDWLSHYGEEHKHFYNTKQTNVKNIGSDGYPYHWWLNAVNTMFTQYKLIDESVQNTNVKIYNASESGVLDIYPFIRYNDTFQDA